MIVLPSIRVEVPVCAFRPYASREYQDTFAVPPPATIYGMLLSLLGVPRDEKSRHRGTDIAFAVAELPERQSRVFRKLRRGDDLESRPDYQDLLTDMIIWVWLRVGSDKGNPPLAARVLSALTNPASVTRGGGLSLGESSYLIDVIKVDVAPPEPLIFIVPDERGFYSLPTWVDHVDRENTVLGRFRLSEPISISDGLTLAWTRI